MDEEQQLRKAVSWQRKPAAAQKLGSSIEVYFSRRDKQLALAGALLETWQQVLPEALLRQSRLQSYKGGLLTAEVMPGPYLHQMQMIREELLKEIKLRCPRCGIRSIELVPMRAERRE